MIPFKSETIRQNPNHMSDVCVLRDISQWQHVINLVTHPVPILPLYGPVIHEFQTSLKLCNKTCPTQIEQLGCRCLFSRILFINLTFKPWSKLQKMGCWKIMHYLWSSVCVSPFVSSLMRKSNLIKNEKWKIKYQARWEGRKVTQSQASHGAWYKAAGNDTDWQIRSV